MSTFKTYPEMESKAQMLRSLALRGNGEALDLLVELHRYDQRGVDLVELGETIQRTIDKAFEGVLSTPVPPKPVADDGGIQRL